MLTANGALKLLDFGIAQARFAARESHTGQMVLGTLNYMAPDYVITGEVTPAIDVYGLALTIYELITGNLFGQPKLREDQHEARLLQRLEIIQPTHPELAELLAQMREAAGDAPPPAAAPSTDVAALAPAALAELLASFALDDAAKLLADVPPAAKAAAAKALGAAATK